jgi:hypothetical protein
VLLTSKSQISLPHCGGSIPDRAAGLAGTRTNFGQRLLWQIFSASRTGERFQKKVTNLTFNQFRLTSDLALIPATADLFFSTSQPGQMERQ